MPPRMTRQVAQPGRAPAGDLAAVGERLGQVGGVEFVAAFDFRKPGEPFAYGYVEGLPRGLVEDLGRGGETVWRRWRAR